MKQELAGIGNGRALAVNILHLAEICRQITIPTPHHSNFYGLGALPVAQSTTSKHWRKYGEEKVALISSPSSSTSTRQQQAIDHTC